MSGRVFAGWLVAFLALFLSSTEPVLAAGPPGVKFAPVPAWVKPLDTENLPSPEASGGVAVLAVDNQAYLVHGAEASFTRTLLRVTNELGAKALGEQKLVFMPPHQTLVLHTLEVRRAGSAVSALRPDAVQVLQREAKLESGVYDGARTAVVVLSDLRVGDVVASEYSLVGANPVAAGHAGSIMRFQAAFGTGRVRYRVVSDRELKLRLYGGAPEPKVAMDGVFHEYLWLRENVPAFDPEDGTPADVEATPWAQLSDYAGWSEVVTWGRSLFQIPKVLPKPLEAWKEELSQESDRARRVLGALRMVQDRVRYLSLAFAESSHRPANPALVLERGFGDCKDKSLLLVTLLRSLGIYADVALVSSTQGEILPRVLPAVTAFDHAIVTVELDGVRYWLDPARLYQRGTLADVSARGFRYALRLADGVRDVEEIEEPVEERSQVNVFMRFDIQRFGGAARLDVATTYVGATAEAVRATHASGSQDDFKNQAAVQVLKVFPRALAGPARVEDREASNEVVVHQIFELDTDDWVQTPDGRKGISVFPPWLFGQMPLVPADRRSPIALPFPLRITHRIEVHSPEDLAVPTTKAEAPTPVFDLSVEYSATGNEAVVLCDFAMRERRILPEFFAKYRSDLAKTTRALDITLTEPVLLLPASRASLFTVLAVWSVVLLAALFYVQLREPYFPLSSVRYRPELAGRSGWLAILGLGVTLSPLRAITTVFASLRPYSADEWSAATNPASPVYHPAWEPLLTTHAVVNATVIVAASYSVYLFWTGRRSFPLVCILMLGLGLVTILGDTLATSLFGPWKQADAQAGLTQVTRLLAVPIPIAWIVYLFRSERVKATFLPPPKPTQTATT